MKKSIFLSITGILFFVQHGYCQKIRTLFYDDILYGKVKQVVAFNYLPGTMVVELADTTWYDENGNTLENHRKTMHGTLFKEKYIISNGAAGKKMEIIGSEHDQNLSAKFDAKGNLAEFDSYIKNGGLNFKSIYQYDERNNLTSYRYLDRDGNVKRKRTYKYDNDDRLIAVDNFGQNGNLEYHADYEYFGVDKARNWTKRVEHTKLQAGQSEDRNVVRQITYY
jgi:hypothetical protein